MTTIRDLADIIAAALELAFIATTPMTLRATGLIGAPDALADAETAARPLIAAADHFSVDAPPSDQHFPRSTRARPRLGGDLWAN